jgi:hypothetical protein
VGLGSVALAGRQVCIEWLERRSSAMLLIASVVNLNRPAHYVHVGHWFQMSVANLVVIVVMLALFALAIALPFPGRRGRRSVS